MREIKFRGKRKDNGEWVYGNLVESVFNCPLIQVITVTNIRRTYDTCEVLPETIGQFTGLKDKNGKEIYEGDIYTPVHARKCFQVLFYNGSFVGGKSIFSCMPLGWLPDVENDEIVKEDTTWMVVIGTIHDNPELLTDQATVNNLESAEQDKAMEAEG